MSPSLADALWNEPAMRTSAHIQDMLAAGSRPAGESRSEVATLGKEVCQQTPVVPPAAPRSEVCDGNP